MRAKASRKNSMTPGAGRSFTRLLPLAIMLGLLIQATMMAQVSIVKVEPTPFFPKLDPGQTLRQQAMLHAHNGGTPIAVTARITVGSLPAYTEELGHLAAGESASRLSSSTWSSPPPGETV